MSAIETYYKYSIIKSIFYWQIDKYRDQWDKLAQKKTHTSMHTCYLKEQAMQISGKRRDYSANHARMIGYSNREGKIIKVPFVHHIESHLQVDSV